MSAETFSPSTVMLAPSRSEMATPTDSTPLVRSERSGGS